MEVRRVGSGEGSRLRGLRLAALADAPHAFSSTHAREAGHSADHWADLARRSSEGDDEAVFVAVQDADWQGMAAVYTPGETGPVLWGMWVNLGARGRGTGLALVEAVAEWARSTGASRVKLSVIEGNESAEGLFRASGFEATGERRPLPDGSGRIEVFMAREL